MEDTYNSIESCGLTVPIYVDTAGIFPDSNPALPDVGEYHIFLLDGKGKVLVVGNPLHNKKIKKLMLSKL